MHPQSHFCLYTTPNWSLLLDSLVFVVFYITFLQFVTYYICYTHTHNRFTAGLEYVRVHPGQQVPER